MDGSTNLALRHTTRYAQWCMNERRITLRDIAIKLQMHHSTVSRALKNDRRIPETTRQRVLEAVRILGYQPDPMLSALMAYRSQSLKKLRYEGTLGWITNYPTRDGWHEYEKVGFFTGAKRRAAELGYKIEVFWLHEPGMTARRITDILLARNIQGLLFIPQPRSRAHLRLDWDKFSAVTLGPTLASPSLRLVDNDHFRSMTILMRQLKRMGYRRPGLACNSRVNNSIDRTWEAAYRVYQTLPIEKQLPLFMHQPWTLREFKRWYKACSPDVIVSQSGVVLSWLRELGADVPGDVGFAMTAKHAGPPHCSGIDENSELVGQAAISLLAEMINRGERGISTTRTSFLVDGKWVDGTTLRRQYPSGVDKR
jgi:LacI family transcriptional regulator